jgi:Arc/MetJ-type ribon-helix-helix transcriptional regulator
MSTKKQRLTVTVDPKLVQAGQRAVESGEIASVSGWVNAALEEKVHRDHKLRLLAAAISDFEDEFGHIAAEEIAAQQRLDRERNEVARKLVGDGPIVGRITNEV